jgi:hypothetical protein
MRYRPERQGVRTYLRTDPDLAAELRRRANLGLAAARATLAAHRQSGAISRSGHVEGPAVGRVARGEDRLVCHVVFDHPGAVSAEFGTKRSRPVGYLRSAVPIIERG